MNEWNLLSIQIIFPHKPDVQQKSGSQAKAESCQKWISGSSSEAKKHLMLFVMHYFIIKLGLLVIYITWNMVIAFKVRYCSINYSWFLHTGHKVFLRSQVFESSRERSKFRYLVLSVSFENGQNGRIRSHMVELRSSMVGKGHVWSNHGKLLRTIRWKYWISDNTKTVSFRASRNVTNNSLQVMPF